MSDDCMRIDERCGFDNGADEYVARMTELTGEFIDQFTAVPDFRLPAKLRSLVPKCGIGRASTWPTDAELAEKYQFKPATKRDTSRVMQQHRE